MTGRITSESAPARNPWGVPYKELYEKEKEASAKMESKVRACLELVIEAYRQEPNSRKRWKLLRDAQAMAIFILS